MKAIWTGSIAFALVNIPIRVYPASEERALELHMLHKKDLSPIHFARICQLDGKEVPYSDIVKGFEYEKGEYVVLDDEDFKAANIKKSSTIEIQYFTDIKDIDPIYFEKPYYLEPDKKATKPYQLLAEALAKSKKVGIANFVFRNKEHIGAVLPSKKGLVLIQMRYYSEIRSSEDLELVEVKTAAKELEMALVLINQSTKPFKAESHHDTYTEDLMAMIQRKLEGKKPAHKGKKQAPEAVSHDLMRLLQESLKKNLEEIPSKKRETFSKQTKKRSPPRKQAL